MLVVPCIFWTVLELLLKQNYLIFKIPYKKVILTFIRSKKCLRLPGKVAGKWTILEY